MTRTGKNFVAIQVKPYAWADEGVDRVLDNIQQKGAVNTVWAYTYDYSEAGMTSNRSIPRPDHAVDGSPRFVVGAFYDYDRKYFYDTILKDFRSPDYGKFNVMTDVAPKVKARSMDFFCWDYNNAFPIMNRSIPNLTKVNEIDVYGRRTTSPCSNQPDYRAHLSGKVESCLSGYASAVDGFAWGCERMVPLQNAIGGGWTTTGRSCFCEHCRAKARGRSISVERAQLGYRQLDELFRGAAQDRRPADGYFVAFWRRLLDYPEILSWEKLWTDSYHEVRAELYGVAKAIAPEKLFGFHVMQNMTFSSFYRAEEDFSDIAKYAGFLKIATYNNAGNSPQPDFLPTTSRGRPGAQSRAFRERPRSIRESISRFPTNEPTSAPGRTTCGVPCGPPSRPEAMASCYRASTWKCGSKPIRRGRNAAENLCQRGPTSLRRRQIENTDRMPSCGSYDSCEFYSGSRPGGRQRRDPRSGD